MESLIMERNVENPRDIVIFFFVIFTVVLSVSAAESQDLGMMSQTKKRS